MGTPADDKVAVNNPACWKVLICDSVGTNSNPVAFRDLCVNGILTGLPHIIPAIIAPKYRPP